MRWTPFLLLGLAGCDAGFQAIDARVDSLMAQASGGLGSEATPPTPQPWAEVDATPDAMINPKPFTVNPPSESLVLTPAPPQDGEAIADALSEAASMLETEAQPLSMDQAVRWAAEHSREYQFARYDYLSTSLTLLSELHLWGPRFSNTVSSTLDAAGTSGAYDTALSVINDFSATHRLPQGGEVSASILTSVTSDIHTAVTSSDAQSSTMALAASVPLLAGAGIVARESLIQDQRNLVYAARNFERFRRTFFRSLVGDYLDLVVQRQALGNAERGVESLRQLARRQQALYDAGRARLYASADAENQALASIARLSQSWERYRLAIDRFKVRIGWPIDSAIRIEPASLSLVPPEVDPGQAVIESLLYRLDLQNTRDSVEDAERAVENARNGLLPDLDLTASVSVPTKSDRVADFNTGDANFEVGAVLELPLDRETQRLAVRQSQITLERARRNERVARDTVAVDVRSALRDIEVFQFSLDLQERNVEIARLGLDSINADPDRVSVLDQTRAISELQDARDARDAAKRDLDLAILDYLLQAGQLRITPRGTMIPIRGIVVP
ncbi:MAG: TolC family protein [Phycisphaerales bacterium]|nr:TolC family protein [Phycisphaerales bacterium]